MVGWNVPNWLETKMNLHNLSVRTTSGEVFSGQESAKMASLIYRRFGKNLPLAAFKWRQMLGNNVSNEDFLALAQAGDRL